jgi:hypothetical protein
MIAFLALVLLAQAQSDLPPVPPAMETDQSPTAFACSFEKVLRGEECAYEGLPAPGDARSNTRSALEAVVKACEASEEPLRKACQDEGARVARSQTCARSDTRLHDQEGRLVQKAADCAEALRRVVSSGNAPHGAPPRPRKSPAKSNPKSHET